MRDPRWLRRFLRNLGLWLIPVVLAWLALTPFYNRFLITGTENLVRLTESPSVTRLQPNKAHYFAVTRTDKAGVLYSVRVTDAHFPLILTALLFLSVPGITHRQRFENLGWSVLISIFFHLLLLLCWVKFVYATQLSWSAAEYPPWKQNVWGLSKHVLDLPVKLGLPLGLWAAFYLREILGGPTER